MPGTEWTSWPLSAATKVTVSPGSTRTSSGEKTKTPVGARLSVLISTSLAQTALGWTETTARQSMARMMH
jgi:hypothetical protein